MTIKVQVTMKSNPARRYSHNAILAIIFTFAVLMATSCAGQKSIVTETPQDAAKQYVEALQNRDLDALSTLTCQVFRSRVDKSMLENGTGFEFGIHFNQEAHTSDISELTYETIWVNSDNEIAHVHIGGVVRYSDTDYVFVQDTIRLMRKEGDIWTECGVVNP